VVPGAPFEDLLGHRYSASLITELEKLSLADAPLPRARRVSQVHSGNWNNVDAYAEPVVMADARRAVVALLGGPAP
jgi:hypothetical protein